MLQIKCTCGYVYDNEFKACPMCGRGNTLAVAPMYQTSIKSHIRDNEVSEQLPKLLDDIEKASRMDVILKVAISIVGLFAMIMYCIVNLNI